jgi:6-pyruvoyltetrahydropterin/6-carboxytetrahydropterin synthase
MQIEKLYHFHAAHRNELLQDKCFNVHGHTYHLKAVFDVVRDQTDPNISVLFSNFDTIEQMLKADWDHALLMNVEDPLLAYLMAFTRDTQQALKIVVLPRATSVENVCYTLFGIITKMGFGLIRLELKETTTSTVSYTKEDWERDTVLFDEGVKWCECVFVDNEQRCSVCDRTKWEFKLAKRRRGHEQSTERTANEQ